jgi:hypothetical protein
MTVSWLRGSILLLAVFAAGVTIGAVYERRMVAAPGSGSPMDPANVMKVLDRDLRLDSAQHASINAILTRHQATIDSTWRAMQPNMRAAIDSTQMEIATVLRADQQAKFIELLRIAHPMPRAIQPPQPEGASRGKP